MQRFGWHYLKKSVSHKKERQLSTCPSWYDAIGSRQPYLWGIPKKKKKIKCDSDQFIEIKGLRNTINDTTRTQISKIRNMRYSVSFLNKYVS